MPQPEPQAEAVWQDALSLLDEENNRLTDK
jgi:hypothetical protein